MLEIQLMYKQGKKLKQIARETGYSINTVRKYIRETGKPVYSFTAILGYSRMLYVEFVKDQTDETVIKCHENAFDYYDGVPKYGLYDNMKPVIEQLEFPIN